MDIIDRVAARTGFAKSSIQIMLDSFVEELSWDELHLYFAELRKGQSIREDAGGYFIRCIKRLFGYPVADEEIITYQKALSALIQPSTSTEAKDE